MTMRFHLRGTVVAGLALAAGLAVGSASAQTKWDMPTPYPDGKFHTKNIIQFAADVDKATNGQLKIVPQTAGSLIKHPEIKKSVRQGVAPIGEVLISLHANESPIYGLDSVPFLATGYDQSKKLYAAQKPFLEKKLADEGLVLLYSVAWPPQGIFAKKEIKSIEDLNGLKFRTYNTATGRIAALAKAVPTQVEAPDLPTAFATGRVEFDDHLRLHGRGRQVLGLRHLLHRHAGLAAAQRRDRQQGRLRRPARGSEEGRDGRRQGRRGTRLGPSEAEASAKNQILKDNKIAILPPSDALKTGFSAIGKQIAEEWATAAGADGKAILDAYAK